MRRTLALPLAVLALVTLHPNPLGAQETKMARGTVTAMAGSSITVKSDSGDMTFSVDAKTQVVAVGAGTRAGRAAAAGKSGPMLNEVIKVGQAVEVSYHDMGGAMHASRIRAVSSAGGGTRDQTSQGTVKSVTLTSLTISGSAGGGATFTRTFAIDPDTKVIAKGAGTAAAAAGGRTPITDIVANGDRVSVSYHPMGEMMHASEVRVTVKAVK
ncbi:MAG: hypothetical protein HY047_04195 [Acidobacteria bacterium]|nr:hypothetical protein [Acidobacteriota bacterium]